MTQVVNLAWTLPTARTDGSALAPSDIAKVTVQTTIPGNPNVVSVDLPGTATSFTTPDLSGTPGGYGFLVFVTDTAGNQSQGATTSATIAPPTIAPPNPVTGLTATVVSS